MGTAPRPRPARPRPLALLFAVTLALGGATTLVTATAGGAAEAGAERIEPNSTTVYGTASPPAPGMALNTPLLGGAARPGGGYWLVAADGGVFSFGEAGFHGSTGSMTLNRPVVGMAAHPGGGGYWLVASDGGVFTFGAADFHGSAGSVTLNQPVVGMAADPGGGGYWLVAADGGIFTFGGAAFHGSTGGLDLQEPIVGMAAHPTGDGYWLVAADGGVFAFGAAEFLGSMGGKGLPEPIVGMAAAASGAGYWLAGRDGEVYEFGVDNHGSAATTDDGQPATVGIMAHVDGGYWLVHGRSGALAAADSGPHVTDLQRQLHGRGFWVGPIEGVYGELTTQAVYAFEKYHGLPVDGEADPEMRRRLARSGRPVAQTRDGDMIEVDKTRQLLFFVRGGSVVWAYNTSTGTEEPYEYEGEQYLADTPPGRWDVYREVDGVRKSNLGRLYRPKYFHTDGIAVHGYSFVPPYPASHGCVRVTNAAIDFIWAEGLMPIGADVWVYGAI